MRDLEEALNVGVWAIACTPCGKYIGQLWGLDHFQPTDSKSYFVEHASSPILMKWPLEFVSNLIPRPMRAPDGNVVQGFERMLDTMTISRCHDLENLKITITPTDFMFFTDMGPKDREWHKNLVRKGIRLAWEQYLKEANIILPPGGFQEGHA
jgi:hypothetical protein